jgi:hypothetical protein
MSISEALMWSGVIFMVTLIPVGPIVLANLDANNRKKFWEILCTVIVVCTLSLFLAAIWTTVAQ